MTQICPILPHTFMGIVWGPIIFSATVHRTLDNSHKCLMQNWTNLGHFGPKGQGPFGQNGWLG